MVFHIRVRIILLKTISSRVGWFLHLTNRELATDRTRTRTEVSQNAEFQSTRGPLVWFLSLISHQLAEAALTSNL